MLSIFFVPKAPQGTRYHSAQISPPLGGKRCKNHHYIRSAMVTVPTFLESFYVFMPNWRGEKVRSASYLVGVGVDLQKEPCLECLPPPIFSTTSDSAPIRASTVVDAGSADSTRFIDITILLQTAIILPAVDFLHRLGECGSRMQPIFMNTGCTTRRTSCNPCLWKQVVS